MEFIDADSGKFAVFHTIYTDSNIFARYDYNERVENTIECTFDKTRIFIYDNKKIIGGFTLKDNKLSYPFIVPPFSGKKAFWDITLKYAEQVSGQKEIYLNEIPKTDVNVLTESFGATLRWSKQRMLRPTEQYTSVLNDDFYFDNLYEKDKSEIVKVVFEAHSDGYTSTIWTPDIVETTKEVERRFVSFGQTNTLYMSNVVKNKANQEIAGVCIAGIYPDDSAVVKTSTIHQVSVKPKYRRKGIAKAMMLKSINEASTVSPVIGLGVLIGNPAEILYKEIGFVPFPSYSELIYTL